MKDMGSGLPAAVPDAQHRSAQGFCGCITLLSPYCVGRPGGLINMNTRAARVLRFRLFRNGYGDLSHGRGRSNHQKITAFLLDLIRSKEGIFN